MSGIYFLFQGGKLVYIGQSANVDKRLSVHHVTFDSHRIIPCDKNDLLKYEKRLINYFKPALNQPTGGKREGAGRKEGFRMDQSRLKEKTKVRRIHVGILEAVDELY